MLIGQFESCDHGIKNYIAQLQCNIFFDTMNVVKFHLTQVTEVACHLISVYIIFSLLEPNSENFMPCNFMTLQ